MADIARDAEKATNQCQTPGKTYKLLKNKKQNARSLYAERFEWKPEREK